MSGVWLLHTVVGVSLIMRHQMDKRLVSMVTRNQAIGECVLQFARWLPEAKLHGAWCGKTYNNTTTVIPTMLQHLWHKSSAPYCMHFDNQLANCNTVATGRGQLVATKWENPLIEVTCNNSVVEVQSFVCSKFYYTQLPYLAQLC